MFIERLKEFQEEKVRLDGIIADLAERLLNLERKITQAEEASDKALIADIEEGSKKTVSEYAKNKRSLDSIVEEHSEISKRLEVAMRLRDEKLRGLLPELRKALDGILQDKYQGVKEYKDEARKRKAEYLLFMKGFNDLRKEVLDTYNLFVNAAHSVGCQDFDKPRPSFPGLNLTGTHSGLHSSLAPLPFEVIEAVESGKIPYFVRLYALTGEMLSEDEAYQRIQQIKREAEKNGQ